jgi:CheY-like chemotaxis protein
MQHIKGALWMRDDTYVLIVDDNPDMRALMSELVEFMGIPVKVARDGIEALQHIHEKTPGFVILDLLMPRMHGLTMLSRLKLDLEMHNIPTLILTSVPLTEREASLLSDSTLGVVRKGDMSLEEIGYLIEETLNGSRPK